VDPRLGLDDEEKRKFLTLPGLELQPFGRPAHSQLLYRLRYPGSPYNLVRNRFKNIFWWGGVIGLKFFSLFQVSGDTGLLLLC
jgi:hypothetical protein